MSDSQKTEAPTPRRIQKARAQGDVWKSKDFTSSIVMIVITLLLGIIINKGAIELLSYSKSIFRRAFLKDITPSHIIIVINESLLWILKILSIFLILVFFVSAVVTFLQVGPLFTFKPLSPDLNRLNPIVGFKKLFNKGSLVEAIKSLIKIFILGVFTYITVKDHLRDILLGIHLKPTFSVLLTKEIILDFLTKGSLILVFLGIFDIFYQRWTYYEKLKMSIQEVKQEMKETEGDPHIKAERRRVHQELLMQSMIENVKKADVVIINPHKIAVALRYDEEKDNAPRVIAKGGGKIAQKIIETARRAGVPILRNVELARALNEVELEQEIPEELYEAVAEILRFVYEMKDES